MKAKNILSILFCVALLASCASSSEVPFSVARNYFVSNQYSSQKPEVLTITTPEEFSRLFGMATAMGKDGRPTPIDFAKSFVIAKTLPETDIATTVAPQSLSKTSDGKLLLKSTVKRGEKQSYTTQPFYAIIVSRNYMGMPVVE